MTDSVHYLEFSNEQIECVSSTVSFDEILHVDYTHMTVNGIINAKDSAANEEFGRFAVINSNNVFTLSSRQKRYFKQRYYHSIRRPFPIQGQCQHHAWKQRWRIEGGDCVDSFFRSYVAADPT